MIIPFSPSEQGRTRHVLDEPIRPRPSLGVPTPSYDWLFRPATGTFADLGSKRPR